MECNLILVQPPLPANERHKKVLPLGLAYMAAYVRERLPGIAISIIDGQVHNMSCRDVVEAVIDARGERTLVGITYWTCQAPAAFSISRALKEADPGITLIHGGIHTTIFPWDALEVADYCVLHEGEETLAELIQCLMDEGAALRSVRGIAYRDGGEKGITAPRPFIDDLDSLPFPAWDLLDMERYDSPLHVVGGRRLPVIGSRGCPYGCTYCGSPIMWKRRVRWRSAENVVGELKASIERLGISQFHFWDDNLMLNRSYIEDLCRLIKREGLDIRWTGLTRASHIARNGDLMGLMKEAGCIGLEVGIESANPKTFYTIQKSEDLKVIEEVARLHKRHGMSPLFTYMAFNPGETISGYYEQARFIDRLIEGLPWYDYFHPMPFPLYTGQFCTPHPGTKLHDDARDLGMVLAADWSDYYHHQINFLPRSLLEDVPRRNVQLLDGFYYDLCNFALQVAFWPQFNASIPVEERRRTLARYRQSIGLFWAFADGRKTLAQLIHIVSRQQPLDYAEAARFCAFTCLILGQMGVIVSSVDDAEREKEIVRVAGADDIPSWSLRPDERPLRPSGARGLLAAFGKACSGGRPLHLLSLGASTWARMLLHRAVRRMPLWVRRRFSGYYEI